MSVEWGEFLLATALNGQLNLGLVVVKSGFKVEFFLNEIIWVGVTDNLPVNTDLKEFFTIE